MIAWWSVPAAMSVLAALAVALLARSRVPYAEFMAFGLAAGLVPPVGAVWLFCFLLT